MWQPTSTAPLEIDLEVAIIDADGAHALVFPCRRTRDGWIDTSSRRRLELSPTHWRKWSGSR
jgi:hypothetical protein